MRGMRCGRRCSCHTLIPPPRRLTTKDRRARSRASSAGLFFELIVPSWFVLFCMSTAWPDYELIDLGEGRKLERFGAWVLDRPCPAAVGVARAKPQAWREAVARYDGDRAAD